MLVTRGVDVGKGAFLRPTMRRAPAAVELNPFTRGTWRLSQTGTALQADMRPAGLSAPAQLMPRWRRTAG